MAIMALLIKLKFRHCHFLFPLREPGIEGREHDQGQQRGTDQSADHHRGQRTPNLGLDTLRGPWRLFFFLAMMFFFHD